MVQVLHLNFMTVMVNMKTAIGNMIANVEPSGVLSVFRVRLLSVAQDVLDEVDSIVGAVIDIFATLFSNDGIISIFYDETDGLTFIGVLLLIVFGFGIVRWGFNWVKKLLALRG